MFLEINIQGNKKTILMSVPENKKRIHSLDALRGFYMFWIIGGGALLQTLSRCFPNSGVLEGLATQMHHVPWIGFHFLDLVFPLFMFISGATIPIAILSKLKKGTPKRILISKVFKRMIVLIILGTIYNGTLRDGFADARYTSILAQIGISYFIASLILIYFQSFKARLYWLIGIIVGFAALQLFVPAPGFGAGVFTPEACINGYIDRMFLPGRLAYFDGIFDALGIISILSATGITLMGYFAGYIILNKDSSPKRKISIMSIIGASLIALAIIVSPFYPVIKCCWTSTYTLLTGGISFLLLALFYLIIDVWGFTKWSFFFRVIGMNSIFIYLFATGLIVNLSYTSKSLLGWTASSLGENAYQLIIVLGNISISWLLLYFMYKKKIFIKV